MKKRVYLRYHQTISRALELNREIYGQKKTRDGKEYLMDHPIRVAGLMEEIINQNVEQHHKSWLLGILHTAKAVDPVKYKQKIDYVLQDLLDIQKDQVKQYINLLTPDPNKTKGEQLYHDLTQAQKLPYEPSMILLFRWQDICRNINEDSPMTKFQIRGSRAMAYLTYLRVTNHHKIVDCQMSEAHKKFFLDLGKQLQGERGAGRMAMKFMYAT